MIIVHTRHEQGCTTETLPADAPLPQGIVWIDLRSPTPEELQTVQKQFGIEIPNKTERWKNHVMNRLYVEDGVAFMTAALISKASSKHPRTSAVTFILSPRFLLTLHEIDPTSFKNFEDRLCKANERFPTTAHLLEGLLEEIITRVAYNAESVVTSLDNLSRSIFNHTPSEQVGKTKNMSKQMKHVLRSLGETADLNSKIHESLHSLSRLMVYFKKLSGSDSELIADIDILIMDASALTTQSAFLSDKITFQLDATLGMINIEQNIIIKMFSIVAVFFLPPTLVGSLYGMNFHHMPELDWTWGYPFALCLMFVSALIPFLYFRRKGWM
ncbi:MAG: magnesium transporter CorA family protein [Alphaproteobacteria bacterium]|nr:magnesium transporter CorA family protein [Alphaproteobacteria bacterium]